MPKFLRFAFATLLLASIFTSQAAENFAACPQFFANGRSPVLKQHATDRALCYDSFAILHSGESKTPVFVAEKLNRASIADGHEKRTNKFFPDARLRSAERATLEDYKNSGFDRGHQFPAGDATNETAMAQSFPPGRTSAYDNSLDFLGFRRMDGMCLLESPS